MLISTFRLCVARPGRPPWSISTISFPASSSSNTPQSSMKQLIDAKRYAEALHMYQQSSQRPTDYDSTMALKACTKLRDFSAGARIHRQLSAKTLRNPFVQTSLIHFYSRQHCDHLSACVSTRFAVRSQRVDEAEKIFAHVKDKTIYMYGALFKGTCSTGRSAN